MYLLWMIDDMPNVNRLNVNPKIKLCTVYMPMNPSNDF